MGTADKGDGGRGGQPAFAWAIVPLFVCVVPGDLFRKGPACGKDTGLSPTH